MSDESRDDEYRPGTPEQPPGPGPGEAAVPSGLVTAVVNLVHTGPVMLGAYTIAELTAVDAIVDFLEARPSEDELTARRQTPGRNAGCRAVANACSRRTSSTVRNGCGSPGPTGRCSATQPAPVARSRAAM